jgi:hypothetical protein
MSIINENKNYFSTSDLALSATLSLYFPLESVDKTNPQKVEFFFIQSSELDQVLEDFWRGELLVEPQTYFNKIKALKARIYEK